MHMRKMSYCTENASIYITLLSYSQPDKVQELPTDVEVA